MGKQTNLSFNDKIDEYINDPNHETFDIEDYYSKKEILPKKRVAINSHDNHLHLESIKQIPKSIWESLKD